MLAQVTAGDTAGDVTGEVADVVVSLVAEAAGLPAPWHPGRDEFDPAVWGLEVHPLEFIGLPIEELAAGIARAAAAGSSPAKEVTTLAAAAARDRQAAQLDLAEGRAGFAPRIAPEADRQRMTRVGYRLLPDVNAIDELTRYEAHLGRQLQVTLNQLERLQALRAGRDVSPSAVLDPTINAGGT